MALESWNSRQPTRQNGIQVARRGRACVRRSPISVGDRIHHKQPVINLPTLATDQNHTTAGNYPFVPITKDPSEHRLASGSPVRCPNCCMHWGKGAVIYLAPHSSAAYCYLSPKARMGGVVDFPCLSLFRRSRRALCRLSTRGSQLTVGLWLTGHIL